MPAFGPDSLHRCNRAGRHHFQAQQRRIRQEVSARDHGQRRLRSSTTTMTAGRTSCLSIRWTGPAITHKSYPALYHNNHDGTFTDVTREAGLAVEMYGMGCAVGDFDNDGYDDIYITARRRQPSLSQSGQRQICRCYRQSRRKRSGLLHRRRLVRLRQRRQARSLRFALCRLVDRRPISTARSMTRTSPIARPKLYKGQSATLFHNLGNGSLRGCDQARRPLRPERQIAGHCAAGLRQRRLDRSFCRKRHAAQQALPQQSQRHFYRDGGASPESPISDAGKTRAGMGTDAGDYDHLGPPEPGDRQLHRREAWRSTTTTARACLPISRSLRASPVHRRSRSLSALSSSTTISTACLDIFAANGHVADDIGVAAAEPSLCGAAAALS